MKINENIFHLYNKWKEGYVRKENNSTLKINDYISKCKDTGNQDIDRFEISEDGKYLNINCDKYNPMFKLHDDDLLDDKIPVPFGICSGTFSCYELTNLVSLEGSPRIVKGNFECGYCNSLTSLEGAPEEVSIDCNINYCDGLTSLEGAPKKVKNFKCNSNEKMTSLKGAPKTVSGYFDCCDCPSLTSLEGLPEKIGTFFACCRCTSLTSLEGAPEEVNDFYCYGCGLTTLEGLPKLIKGDLYIDASLEDKIPDYVVIKGRVKNQ